MPVSHRLYSCDDHLDIYNVPRDLWTRRLPQRLCEAGPHVVEERIYPTLLEKALGAAYFPDGGGRVETLNFGVPGYNATQEAEVLAVRIAPFAPDVVVVGYVGNDDQMPSFIDDILEREDGGLRRRSALFDEFASIARR